MAKDDDRDKQYSYETPSPQRVTDFHKYSDLDSGNSAQHHTLGRSDRQAAPGNHIHDGITSELILRDAEVSGSRGDGTALQSIIGLLVQMGAVDNTNP